MAIVYRTAFCEVCDRESKQWRPSHRTLWNCDTCNTANLDEKGHYNCFNSLRECVRCDTFLTCLGRLDETLLERVVRFKDARERLERQEVYVLQQSDGADEDLGWSKVRESSSARKQKKVQVWLYSDPGEGPAIYLFRLVPERGSFWQPVTGRVDEADGSLEEAALRELEEETGVAVPVEELVPLSHHFSYFNKKRGIIYQEYSFAVKVDPGFSPMLSGEHTEWKLVTPPEALEVLPWREQRVALERLVERLEGVGTESTPTESTPGDDAE